MLKFLDCFCGLGGASEGFYREGFDCTGIDIRYVGYPYNFIYKDFMLLNGEDFKDYDVIWGSPPCRDFSLLGQVIGHTWKRKPDPEYGLNIVRAFLKFVEKAEPRIWIMENVDRMRQFYKEKPRIESCMIKGKKRHAFWGNFPLFLMPQEPNFKLSCGFHKEDYLCSYSKMKKDKRLSKVKGKTHLESWENARIPFICSLAFAQACKEKLDAELY